MDEHALREMVQRVQDGRFSRRHFVQTMAGLGVARPWPGLCWALRG